MASQSQAQADDEERPDDMPLPYSYSTQDLANAEDVFSIHRNGSVGSHEGCVSPQKQFTALITMAVVEKQIFGEDESFHGALTGKDAVEILQDSGKPNCYLTRWSDTRQCYILTVYSKRHPKDVELHFKIQVDPRHKLEGTDKEFDNIQQLLEHYEGNWIHPTLKNIGEKYTKNEYERRAESNRGNNGGASGEKKGDDTQKQTERQQSQQHVLQQAAVEKEDAVKSKDDVTPGEGANLQAQSPKKPPASTETVAVHIEENPDTAHQPSGGTADEEIKRAHKEPESAVFTLGVNMDQMIGEHPSHHQGIPRDEAVRRLQESKKPHCYLISYDEQQDSYVLTVYKKQRPKDIEKHFKIKIENSRPRISGLKQDFDNIGQLLEHYESHSIHHTLKNIGEGYREEDYEQQEAARQKRCIIL